MTIPKKYLVFGYFGGWNSGDEAILESVRRMLCQEHADAEVVAICSRVRPEYASVYKDHGIKMIEARSLMQIFRTLRTHQLIIGGGQMITGDRSLKGLSFILLLCLIAKFRSGRARMIGIGVEGVSRFRAKWMVRQIASLCECINVRDSYSLEMLQRAGCTPNRLRLAADVVLSGVVVDEPLVNVSNSIESQNETAPIVIGVHHSPVRVYSNDSLYVDLITAIRKRFPLRKVVVVSNDARQKFDAGLLDELRPLIDDEDVIWQHFESLEKTIDTYRSAACVVSVRMHPLILALIHGVNVVGIAKSNKVITLGNRVGFQLHDMDQAPIDSLLSKIEKAIESEVPDLQNLPDLAWSNVRNV